MKAYKNHFFQNLTLKFAIVLKLKIRCSMVLAI